MALNLVRPTSGAVRILGRDVWRRGGRVLARVGALIEEPTLYPDLSGRDNLRAFAAALGGLSPGFIEKLLDVVGITDRQHDRARTYSLGMKQRLGLGVPPIRDPDLLVRDGPARGPGPS